jgi:uncharacterized membrane protein SirB2
MDIIKLIHVSTALLSISGFVARGILMMRGSALLQARWVKVLPHVNDTLLLASAIFLASQWGWAALQLPWLLAKIVALLVYIALGMVALRAGRTKAVRVLTWLAAVLVFAYIVAVARSKSPLIFF